MTAPVTDPTLAPEQEPTVLHTVSGLLATIDRLPPAERAAARARVDTALERDARSCRVALGLLALDLAAPPRRDLEVRVHLIDLDRVPAAATA